VIQTYLFAAGSVFLGGRFAFQRTVLGAQASEECTGFAGCRSPTRSSSTRWTCPPSPCELRYLPLERAEENRGSIRTPIPGLELAVVDDLGRALPSGETGHLVARGDNVILGYLEEPEETSAILHDGWFWIDDLAERDDGFFHDRRSPAQPRRDRAVAEHPDVAEAAVIGIAHDLMGEGPAAFAGPRPDRFSSDENLRRFCRERTAPHLVPVTVTSVAQLALNEAGKLLWAELAKGFSPAPLAVPRGVDEGSSSGGK
jgi:long-chain acyl-CoA synthetase